MDNDYSKDFISEISSSALGTLVGGPFGALISAVTGILGIKVLDAHNFEEVPFPVLRVFDAYQNALHEGINSGVIRKNDVKSFGKRQETATIAVREGRNIVFEEMDRKVLNCFYEALDKNSISYLSVLEVRHFSDVKNEIMYLRNGQAQCGLIKGVLDWIDNHVRNRGYVWTEEEIENYGVVLQIIRDLAKVEPSTYCSNVARTLNNLAILHKNANKLSEAELEYKEALKISRKLAESNPSVYRFDVAATLNNLANLHTNTNRLFEAEKEYNEALRIRRESAEPKYIANVLNNLAILHQKTNRLSEAEREHVEALEIRRELAESNPSAYLPDVAETLNNLAVLHQNTNRLSEAEQEYEEALEIRRKLAESNPSAFRSNVATTLNNLAGLHKNTNKLLEAEQEYEEALKIRRELAESSPLAFRSNVATTLNNLAGLHKNTNKFLEAEQEYEEALRIRSELAESNPSAYLPDVAHSLVNIGKLHFQMRVFYSALQEFQEVIEICQHNSFIGLPDRLAVEKNFTDCFTQYLMSVFKDNRFKIEQDVSYSYFSMTDTIGHVDYLVKREEKPFIVIELKYSGDERQDFIPNQMPLVMESMRVQYGIYISDINRCQFYSSSGKTENKLGKLIKNLLNDKGVNSIQEITFNANSIQVITTGNNICNSIKTLFAERKKGFSDRGMNLEIFFKELGDDSFLLNGDSVRFSTQDMENSFFMAMLGKPEGKICRYTSLNSLFLTLDGSTHTMCNINCMNDPLEVMYADNYINPLKQSNIEMHKELSSEANLAFIISCSKSFDDLMMWRLYGDDAKGVCIIYDVGDMQSGFSLANVNYARGRGDHPELDFIKYFSDEKIIGNGHHFSWYNWDTWKHFFKTSDYAAEKEVRLLYIRQEGDGINERWIIDNTNNVISPILMFNLYEHKLPLSISEILLGCKVRQRELNVRQLEYLIKRKDIFNGLKIETSTIECYR